MRRLHTIIIMMSVCLCISSGVRADFDDTGLGARAIGMGSAFTAVADDVFTLYYNPAGLAFLKRKQCATEYSRLYMGLDDDSNLSRSFIGYAHPLHVMKDKKRFWKTKTADPRDLPYRDYGTVALGLSTLDLVGSYEERVVYVSYARKVGYRTAAGISVKNLYEKYTMDDYLRLDPVFEYGKQDSLQTISVDLGLLFRPSRAVSLGLSIRDINQPDLGLKSTSRLLRQYRFGGRYRRRSFSAVADVVKKSDDVNIHIGAEGWMLRRSMAFRAGYIQGSRQLRQGSAGLSVDLFDIRMDYAFQLPLAGIKDISGSHRVSLIVRFGRGVRRESGDEMEDAFIRIQQEQHDLKEKYSQGEVMRGKIEEKYMDDTIRSMDEIERLKKREQELLHELKERPVRIIRPPKHTRPLPPPPDQYTVEDGDTLQSIAVKLYGDPARWNDLYRANKRKIIRSRVEPGQVLDVPR